MMRTQFFKTLCELAKEDKDIMVLVDDLGFSFCEEFVELYPTQFINCGIIEQTMVSIAAGLSFSGKKVYIYGTIPFVIMRPFEFIRDQICYNKNKVIIAGVSHSGFLGFSHNISKDEDIKILKHLPNIDVYTPKNESQLQIAMIDSYKNINSAYIRI